MNNVAVKYLYPISSRYFIFTTFPNTFINLARNVYKIFILCIAHPKSIVKKII